MLESGESWLDSVSLSHLEVLSEVLVSAPPVSVDHGDSLVSSDLMEVGISHIIFLVISFHFRNVKLNFHPSRFELTSQFVDNLGCLLLISLF